MCPRVHTPQWKILCALLSSSVMSNSLWPHGLACQAHLPMGYSRQGYRKLKVIVTQLCPTLHSHGLYSMLQARILKWVAFPFSRGSSQPRGWTLLSRIAGGFFTSWATREAWSGLPFPSPRDIPDPGIKPESLVSPALAVTWEAPILDLSQKAEKWLWPDVAK